MTNYRNTTNEQKKRRTKEKKVYLETANEQQNTNKSSEKDKHTGRKKERKKGIKARGQASNKKTRDFKDSGLWLSNSKQIEAHVHTLWKLEQPCGAPASAGVR